MSRQLAEGLGTKGFDYVGDIVTKSIDPLPAGVRAGVIDPGRRRALSALQVLDGSSDADFDRLVRLAAAAFGTPIAALTLIDGDSQTIKASMGLEQREMPVEQSFGAHLVASSDDTMIVSDATADPRFSGYALVTGPPGIRFWAGAPIIVKGYRLGVLAVASPEPSGTLDKGRIAQLVDLADTAASLFALKDEVRVRSRAAADLMKEEWRHALTLEAGKVGSWVWDMTSGEVVANDMLRRMFGIEATATTIDELFAGVHPEHLASVRAALDEASTGSADYLSEFRVRSGRWLIGRGRVYQRDAAGKPLIMMGVCIDITDAREAADHTRHLLRELNHRVKNTLAMIQSLARQTSRQSPDPQDFIAAFSGRLRTLSEAHALLAARDWSGIGLVELVHAQVMPHLLDEPGRLTVTGSDVQLPPDHALGLALILNELVSNAVRYGALSVPEGRVQVGWERQQGAIELGWKETGGPRVEPPVETGFGTRLIQRSLDKIIDSHVSLDFPPDGVEARIRLPLD